MNEGVIERYDTFYTKGCQYKLFFGDLNDQPIPYKYYNVLYDDNENGNNILGTLVDDASP